MANKLKFYLDSSIQTNFDNKSFHICIIERNNIDTINALNSLFFTININI